MTHEVRLGVDRFLAGHDLLRGNARLAVLTNAAARTGSGARTLDALVAGGRVEAILTPEHGLAAAADAGAPVPHSSVGNLPVYSLYGADWAPAEEAIARVDVVVIDLPDAGCRYYTYPWTVREVMRSAARVGTPVVLLDRPNPLGGEQIEGPYPDPGYDSAVCASCVPVVHGLTPGELARWNADVFEIDVDLTVVEMEGWRRAMTWRDTGLPLIPPSPNLRSEEALFLYPGTCLFEGTNLSEGRGTEAPFLLVGAPFLDEQLVERLRRTPFPGVVAEPAVFTPTTGKWSGEECRGVRLRLTDRHRLRPLAAGLWLIAALVGYEQFAFIDFFDGLAGGSGLREQLARGASGEEIAGTWQDDEREFAARRERFLLYP